MFRILREGINHIIQLSHRILGYSIECMGYIGANK